MREHSVTLSSRSARVLPYFFTALSEKDIGRAVVRSRHTIHAYAKEIYKAFGVNSRAALMALALTHLTERLDDTEPTRAETVKHR
ncbi:MAG: LuxR C-terminal-related transcriptional regulator [Planctomycetota bacterium]